MTAWTDLRDEIQNLRTAAYDVATDLSGEGKDAERVFGRVDGYDDVLRRMASVGAPSPPEMTFDGKDYPAWVEKLSMACSTGEDCGACKWPLCSCPHHADDPGTSAPRAGEKE